MITEVYENIKAQYLNHDLVRGNMSILLNFAQIKMMFDTQPDTLDQYAMLNPIFRKGIKGSLSKHFAAAGIKKNRPTDEERQAIIKLCVQEGIFDSEIEFYYKDELIVLKHTDLESKDFDQNIKMLYRFYEIRDDFDAGKLGYDETVALLSKKAQEPVFLIGSTIKKPMFFCDIENPKILLFWRKPQKLDNRLVVPSPQSVLQAMSEICDMEMLKAIMKRADEIEQDHRLNGTHDGS